MGGGGGGIIVVLGVSAEGRADVVLDEDDEVVLDRRLLVPLPVEEFPPLDRPPKCVL